MGDTFHKTYTELSDEQKKQVADIKDKAEELLTLFGSTEDRSEKSRCIALAKTNLEQAVMWAIKGVCK